jgi:hypothetical protein
MSYTGSKVGIGLGTILQIGSGGTSETFTAIGEITGDVKMSGRTAKTIDITNMNSTASEFVPVLADSGTLDFTMNFVSSDAGQVALEAAFAGLVKHNFKLQYPKTSAQTTTGDLQTFNALVQELDYGTGVEKNSSVTVKLKISGPITTVAGS